MKVLEGNRLSHHSHQNKTSPPLPRRILAFDFDRDIAPVLRFLAGAVGVRDLAHVATNAPMLFQHPVQGRRKQG